MADHDFSVENLGECRISSPIEMATSRNEGIANYIADDQFVRLDTLVEGADGVGEAQLLQRAGPRQLIYFSPAHVHAGIVSCGGLCPGINDVIRAVVRCLWYRYGVKRISGISYGYKGFLPELQYPVIPLTPEAVDDIHKLGGTFLGSSRGGGNETAKIVDAIERLNLNVLFTIGGDGTQHGALAIANEIEKRRLKIAIIGIPKTVDNDFFIIDRSFGFNTAVERAKEVVSAAHMEADSAINGIGLVKVMGRESGFIATCTALASHEVNFVLIPEVHFDLEGSNGFLYHLEQRLLGRQHAVIIVAEGAMQDTLMTRHETDASGNLKLADVGTYLRDRIIAHFKEREIEINLKYIDPSYVIRSSPANAADSIYCERLGNAAAHAAMAGKNKVIIGLVNNKYVHLPIQAAIAQRRHVDPEGNLWRDALDATHQPAMMANGPA
ncbi:MAG: ATP-dependent 6-phosphofructokinase [Treponema sp.]|nr:ATP-dependent 6-phosphofructokinase [Treponema sp.]